MARCNYTAVEGCSFNVCDRKDILYSFTVTNGKLVGCSPQALASKEFDSLNALHHFYNEKVDRYPVRRTSKHCYEVHTGKTLFELTHNLNQVPNSKSKDKVKEKSKARTTNFTNIEEVLTIYACIKRLSVNYGKCYPSNATLAKYTGVPIDSVYTYIGILNDTGYIKFDCIYRQGRRLRALVPLV